MSTSTLDTPVLEVEALGERQQAILEFVRSYTQQHGHPPTLREIANGIGIRSTSNVVYHVNRLVNQGYLRKQVGKTRTLVLLNAEPVQPIPLTLVDLQSELMMLRSENQRLREWCRQLQRLAESNLAIVEYFNKIGLPGSVIFQKYFAQNNGSDVIVQLGFDDVETPKGRIGPFQGLTPYADGDNTLSLGSQTSVATITHEFFHQLDRHFNPILSYEDPTLPPNEEMGLPNYLTQIAQNSLLPNDPTQHLPFQRFGIILGHASDDDEDNAEILADLGMTAVLAGLGYEAISPSGDKDTVGFDPRKQNAQDVECALRQYFVQIFSGKTSDFTFDLSLCS